MTTLYGIKNCDTVKKARQWMEQHSVPYRFHDFRADGLEATQIVQWLEEMGWETLINKRSTTWKELPQSAKDALNNDKAAALIKKHPTLIKRPLLDHQGERSVGFKAQDYQQRFVQS